MCYSPKIILNPKKRVNALFDRRVLEVPCGTCKECFDARRNGFFIRMYYEYLDVISKGGFAFFLTLTYNNASINRLPSGEYCFRHDDVKNYLKLIRIHLKRDYNIDPKDCVRYFVCSEFGEERHRPHYHVIFYVLPPVKLPIFVALSRRLWHHGFTMPGKYNGGIVQDIAAFSYVAKYTTKGEKDASTYKHLVDVVSKSDFPDDMKRYYLHNSRPIIRASKNFGMYLLSVTDFNKLEKGFVSMPDKHYTIKDFQIPLYYDRKIFYDVVMVDGSPCYRLNSDGYKMKLIRFELFKKAFCKQYDLVSNTHFSPTLFNDVNVKFRTNFKSNDELFQRFRYIISNDWNNLFSYSLVYNGYTSLFTSSVNSVSDSFSDFNTRLRLLLGYPVDDDALQSLAVNSQFYEKNDYSFALRLFRYLVFLCNYHKQVDFFSAETIRAHLTNFYYKTQVNYEL